MNRAIRASSMNFRQVGALLAPIQWSTSATIIAFTAEGRGLYAVEVLASPDAYSAEGRGIYDVKVAQGAEGRGQFALLDLFSAEGRGQFAMLAAFTAEGRGIYAVGYITFTADGLGLFRVADDTMDRYELYRGIDGATIDYDAPWETFTTLPHTTAALAVDAAYAFVLRKRNQHNETSLNIEEFSIEIDAGGDLVATRPSAPVELAIAPAASGAVLITADYYYVPDGDDAATLFAIWLTTDGSTPDPDIDAVTATATMIKADGVAKLSYTSTTFADALTANAIVRTRRIDAGPVNVDSDNAAIVSTTTDTDGPATPDADVFFGDIAKQGQ